MMKRLWNLKAYCDSYIKKCLLSNWCFFRKSDIMNTKENLNSYIVTRYFLNKDAQMHMDDMLMPKTKEQIFSEVLLQLKNEKYICGFIGTQQYRIYFSKTFSDTRLLLKFAKRKDITLNTATETDINKVNKDDYPFSYIIVDTNKQLFLIQKNKEISTNSQTLVNSVEKIFSSFLIKRSISLRLTPITKRGTFWDAVEKNMGKISSLEFEFLSPNYLGQSYKINELMKELKSETNTDSMKMAIKNEKGNLTILNKYHFFKDSLQYISNGGGKWKMKFLGGGNITSEEKPVEQTVDISIMQNNSDANDKLQEVFQNIDLIEGDNHEEDVS